MSNEPEPILRSQRSRMIAAAFPVDWIADILSAMHAPKRERRESELFIRAIKHGWTSDPAGNPIAPEGLQFTDDGVPEYPGGDGGTA